MDVPRVVRTQVTTGELDPPQDLVNSVNDSSVPLLDVVKALGEYLTSTEDDVRLKGLTFLTNLVKVISSNRINRQATVTLTRFYLSKLDDFDSLPPALSALIILSKLPTFDDDAAVEVYRAVVEQVNMKAYVQATRHLVYQLFDSFLALHRQTLKNMGADFLNSYTKMVDGEKDPRNLMLLFSMDRVILLEFDVKDLIEDFFDITFCYFPISFKPPPNDPYGITAEDLKSALRKCMAASPYFAKLALPLFLEKYATAVGQSMKDLMLSMAACFPVYGGDAVRERGTELWDGIKTEIMYSSDKSVEAAALSALESLMRTLYPSEADAPVGLAQDIIKQCLDILDEPEKTQSLAATKALVALLNASPSTGKFAVSQALPQLFKQFNRPSLPSHRIPILWSISSLLIAASKVYAGEAATRSYAQERTFEHYREALMDTLREGLRTEGLKEAATRGCVALTEIPGFWGRDEVEEVVRGIDDALLNDNDSDVRSAVVTGLTGISKVHPTVIESVTLPLLFHALPEHAPELHDTSSRDKYRSILRSLSELCVQPALFETLVIRITTKLDFLTSSTSTAEGETPQEARECEVAYAWDLLYCLAGVVDKKVDDKHVDVVKHFDTIVPRLYALCISAAAPKSGDQEPLFRDRRLLTVVGRITERLVWELNADRQGKHFAAVFAAFAQGEMTGILPASVSKPPLTSSPLRLGAPSPEQDLIVLYSSVVQGLKADCQLPFPSYADWLAASINWTINHARDPFHVRWAADMIAAFVNKRASGLAEPLPGMLETIWVSDVQDTSKEFETRRRALLVYLHITKALALVRDPLAYTAIERIVDVFKLAYFDPAFVNEAAKGLGVIAEGKGKAKERGSHLTAKLLWAQKVWGFALPRIIEGDQDAKGKDRLVYLTAFSALLPLVPASLLLADLQTILPLLLRSLALPAPGPRTNAITALHGVLETKNLSAEVDTLVHDRSTEMVESLIKSVFSESQESSGTVRAAALRCLAMFPDAVRFEALQALKSKVIKDLGKALDDPMRVVRREAVECRAKWYRYGQPT